MTINQSPIFKLLQASYADIELSDNLLNISNPLFTMVISDYYRLPGHIKLFFKNIKEGLSLERLDEILSLSVEEMSKKPCCNCSSCQGCCKLFYATIAQDYIIDKSSMPTPIIDKWTNFINDTKKEFGDCSFTPIPSNIRKHIIAKNSIYDMYSSQKEKSFETRNIENSLIVLKGLSSSTPYLYNGIISNGHFTGGGLFVNWNNIGIVIDPGFGFIENMQKNKLFIDDIDIVIITHFHIDHTNDIRLLDDLNRSINHNLKEFGSEEEYNKYCCKHNHKFHKIKWYVDSDTAQNLMPNLNPLINEIQIIENSHFNEPIHLSDDIELKPFQTNHVQINYYDGDKIKTRYKNNTFGITLKLKKVDNDYVVLGYTSDTAFYSKLTEHLKDATCLVANISGIYEDDYLQIKYKGRHLGYAGCKKLLEKVSPKVFVVSEFWNGITDLRYDVCRDLQKHTQDKVLPGEIGLQINLSDCSVRCSICGRYVYYKDVAVISPIEQMEKLSFVCDECRY